MYKLQSLSENEKIEFIKFLLIKDRNKTHEMYILAAICVACVLLSIFQRLA